MHVATFSNAQILTSDAISSERILAQKTLGTFCAVHANCTKHTGHLTAFLDKDKKRINVFFQFFAQSRFTKTTILEYKKHSKNSSV